MRKKAVVLFLAPVLIGAMITLISCGGKEEGPPPGRPAQAFLKLMPDNTFMYIGFKDWKVLRDQTGAFDFITTARRLKLGSRIKKIFSSREELTPQVKTAVKRLEEMRSKISLWELLGGEISLAGFTDKDGRFPALALLVRIPEGKEKLYEDYFTELAGLAAEKQGWEFKDSVFLEEKITTVVMPEAKIESRPSWVRVDDMLIVSSREEGARLLIQRIKSEAASAGLLKTAEFRRVFDGLDPAAMGVTYIHPAAFTSWAKNLYRIHKKQIDQGIESTEDGPEVESREVVYYLKGVVKIIETIEVISGNFELTEEGYREEARLYLDPEDGSKNLVSLITRPPQDWGVLDYIPAGSVGVSAGYLEFDKVYGFLLGFLGRDPVGGNALKTGWETLQDQWGFHPAEDLFSWMGDEYGAATLSAPTSMLDPGSFAYLVEVKSPDILASKLDRFSAFLEEQGVTTVEDEYQGMKMRVVYLPVPALPLTPTLGRVGDYLVLASRQGDFRRVVDTIEETAESIRSDPDFRRMRKRLGETGTDFTFIRVEERIDSLVTLLRSSSSMVGMIAAAAASPASEENDDLRPEDIVGLINDTALVLKDLKVFKFFGVISRWEGDYYKISEFIEIGDKE